MKVKITFEVEINTITNIDSCDVIPIIENNLTSEGLAEDINIAIGGTGNVSEVSLTEIE